MKIRKVFRPESLDEEGMKNFGLWFVCLVCCQQHGCFVCLLSEVAGLCHWDSTFQFAALYVTIFQVVF